MNVFRNDLILAKRQGPITGSGGNKHFVKRVKPLYLNSEKEIIAYSKLMKFPVKYTRCPCSVGAYRREYRDMLDAFEKRHPPIKYNIVNFLLRSVYAMKKQNASENNQEENNHESSADIGSCVYCGEPCAKEICKRCQILTALKREYVK
jgi:uncharacterized protein (TIGR00269 family)